MLLLCTLKRPTTVLGFLKYANLQTFVSTAVKTFAPSTRVFLGCLCFCLCFLCQCGEILYEKRHYEKGHWACIIMREETYEQSICYGFMRIMRYICQHNSLGESGSKRLFYAYD